ncbi:MAG: chemotaxis protein CheW [Candidatus Hydrogenedentota bacterium]
MNDNGSPRKAQSESHEDSLIDKAGQYLTFSLGDDEYGVEILRVQEFVGLTPVKRIPGTPAYIRGLVSLRGQNIPVIELRRLFSLDSHEDTERTSIIVIHGSWKSKKVVVGLLVDEVREVAQITEEQIEPPPPTESTSETSFIMATAQIDSEMVALLDPDKLFESKDLSSVV